MKKKLIALSCVACLVVSANSFASGGKKGPPAAQSQAWYSVLFFNF